MALSSGCGAGMHGTAPSTIPVTSTTPLNPVAVDERAYAESAYRVLLAQEGTPEERMDLMAGVVRHQLERAQQRFRAGQSAAGLRSFAGAAFMLRAGEQRTKIFEGHRAVLKQVVGLLARKGNEGQSTAIYQWLLELAESESERADTIAHLDALETWQEDLIERGGPLQAAGSKQRIRVQRALLDSSEDALLEASDAIVAWMRRALESDLGQLPITTPEEREEALEAYRAIKGGGITLVGLMLRHGRLRQALEIIEREDLTGLVPPALIQRAEQAAYDDDEKAWAELFGLYESINEAGPQASTVEVDVARGAAWGAALELHRSAPNSTMAVKPLAHELAAYGMSEVAALMLSRVYGSKPSSADLSWALALCMQALVMEEQAGQLEASRRVFQETKPLLDIAAKAPYASKVQPSVARFEYVMGALELRAANLDRARDLLQRAARREPTTAALEALTAIQRQRGDAEQAMNALSKALEIAARTGQNETKVRLLLTLAEIQRQFGKGDVAATLEDALSAALEARRIARTNAEQATVERLLAHVLDFYGRAVEARQAMGRAYELSRSQQAQLTATVLDASRRALLHGELPAARDAVHEAIDAELEDDDLVYVAVWLRLLELRQGVPSDGTVERAMARIGDDMRWVVALRDWALGKIDDKTLTSRARGRVERTEALFYTTMANWRVRAERIPPGLRDVAQSEAVELMEVDIARELIAREELAPLRLEISPNVQLP